MATPAPHMFWNWPRSLDLTPDQRTRVQGLFDAMKAEALPLGSRLIEQEAALDRQFAMHTVTPESLRTATAEVAGTQGALRETRPQISFARRSRSSHRTKCSAMPNYAAMAATIR